MVSLSTYSFYGCCGVTCFFSYSENINVSSLDLVSCLTPLCSNPSHSPTSFPSSPSHLPTSLAPTYSPTFDMGGITSSLPTTSRAPTISLAHIQSSGNDQTTRLTWIVLLVALFVCVTLMILSLILFHLNFSYWRLIDIRHPSEVDIEFAPFTM
jgi:hypothetical protein